VKLIDEEGFGNCSVIGAAKWNAKTCTLDNTLWMNREYILVWIDKE